MKQARLYFDSLLDAEAGRVAWKIENVHGGEAKQGIHYHIVDMVANGYLKEVHDSEDSSESTQK